MTSSLRRPPRLERIFAGRTRPIFFVTCCTAARLHLLDNPPVHDAFRAFAARSPDRIGIYVGRYVIMPDHLHAFVSAEGSKALAQWMAGLKREWTRALKGIGCPGPHWQQGFFDHVLRSHESYAEKWRYVEQNPVRAGLVEHVEDWPYAGEIERLEF